MPSTRRLSIPAALVLAAFLAATPAAQAQSCPPVDAASIDRLRCLLRHALDQARLAAAHARTVPGATAASVQLSERLVEHLQAALDNPGAETDSVEELLRAHATHRGLPSQLMGGLQNVIGRLGVASQIGASAMAHHATSEQFTAWEWSTQALEAAQRLWRPWVECYLSSRVRYPVPATRSTPPCP